MTDPQNMTDEELAAALAELEGAFAEAGAIEEFYASAGAQIEAQEKALGRTLTDAEGEAMADELVRMYERGADLDGSIAFYTAVENPLDLDKDSDRIEWMRDKVTPSREPAPDSELPLDATDQERQAWMQARVFGVPVEDTPEPDAPAGE